MTDKPETKDNKEAEAVQATPPKPTEADADTPLEAEENPLAAELDAALAEAKTNFDKWQRVLADFDNYKKRIERERVETYEHAVVEVIKAVLPVIDDFERAIENMPEELAENAWVNGTSAIGRKLNRLLETYEIEPIDPVGQPFDPDKHQGLGIDEDSDMESGHVTATLQKGYIKGDKLLRPALVRVSG